MNDWLIMTAMALTVFAGLVYLGGLQRRGYELVAAALILAMAGYAWQGRAGLEGQPAEPELAEAEVGEALVDLRADMDRNFGAGKFWIVTSDGYSRRGEHQSAARILSGGLRKNPRDPDLWTALGVQLMLASDGRLSPAAMLAFDKARALAPTRPGPDYFTGLAALREGRPIEAANLWRTVLERGNSEADWYPAVARQFAALVDAISPDATPARPVK